MSDKFRKAQTSDVPNKSRPEALERPGSPRQQINPQEVSRGRLRSDLPPRSLSPDLTPYEKMGYATEVRNLPPLASEHARIIHITRNPDAIPKIIENGLDYSHHGAINSTARIYASTDNISYAFPATDHRFTGPCSIAIVMDIPFSEVKIHQNLFRSPGHVPAKYLVGIIDVSDVPPPDKPVFAV